MLIGVLLLMRGWQAVRAAWFPLLFLLFLIPLPGLLVEIITGSLKQHVSGVAEEILYAAGYPIARMGVMLSIGQYKLLVADACSGLNSMFSLSALGLLYLYLMKYRSWLHNGLLLLAVLPIAFAANVIRVMALVLITYYFGDEAGQGFAHAAAGMVLFVAALLLLMLFDVVLRLIFFRNRSAS
jgi:exosortase B